MSASGGNVAPVIIKKKKITGGDGHHGGAWKVAYADFVTAMMAFFLLMWLLNATTEKQRKGIADYFSPTVPISRISGGGSGDFGGDSVFSEMDLPQNGTGASNRHPTESRQARGAVGVSDVGNNAKDTGSDKQTEQLQELEQQLLARAGESSVSDDVLQHIVTRVTDEGLVIELFDIFDRQLFQTDTNQPTDLLNDLVVLVASVVQLVSNPIVVEAHTRSKPIVVVDNPVWDLSMSRADRIRRMLESEQVQANRMHRVTGHADRTPIDENRMAVRNNRVEIILLRSDR
jgi:chemotaxis protein MotB